MSHFDISYFKGTYPDISKDDFLTILGAPDEAFESTDKDAPGVDYAYYYPEGRLLLYWSSEPGYEVGVVEFRPKVNMTYKEFTNLAFKIEQPIVHFYCGKTLLFAIYLQEDLLTLKKIQWWNNQ